MSKVCLRRQELLKKLVIFFMIIFSCQSVLALDRAELNLDSFQKFHDDCLMYYINTALENNHNLKIAGYRVEQYRQQAKYSLGQELPHLGVNANYLGIHVPQLDNFELEQNAFVLPFMVNYEADFLLKNRDKTRSAKKAYEAAKFEEKSVYISLLSDIASVYTNILQYDYLIKKQEYALESFEEIYKSEARKLERGVINNEVLKMEEQRLNSAKNSLLELRKERDTLLMQLAVLCGMSSECISELKRGELERFEYSGEIPSSVDSDIIFSRPDVMKAEKNLEKAKIDVRVARKEFLPRFNITGLWIFNTIAPGTFFSWDASIAAILAGASQDIFKGGMKVANLKLQKAKYEELFEDYRQTSLEAVKEVNTALCIIKQDTELDRNTKEIEKAEALIFYDNLKKHSRGTISAPDFLRENTRFVDKEQKSAQTKTRRLVDYFTLYKASGGRI